MRRSPPAPMMTLAQAGALLPGSMRVGAGEGNATLPFARVHSDSRSTQAGDLFVALRGDHFDGHAHLHAARKAGAVAALAEHGLQDEDAASLPGLRVADSLQALQQLATRWRAGMKLPLIAVTGSNGKTTVTQMVASMLRAWLGDGPHGGSLATAGNFNNHIGVPLTLLRLRQDKALWHKAAVLELGMNHPGEIALLARMAAPTVALVNNAQREHQEFMTGVEAVARENGSVIDALSAHGTAVLPADDPCLPIWREMAAGRHVCTFALDGPAAGSAGSAALAAPADISGFGQWQDSAGRWLLTLRTPAGVCSAALALPGRHNIANALAAAACALSAGAPLSAVAQGLDRFQPVGGRSQLHSLRLGGRAVSLVDDSYNANPDSVRAAIEVLAALPGPHWLVLGDMGEVGAQGPAFHAEIGAYARQCGIEQVWAAGTLMAHAGAHRHFASVATLLETLAAPGEMPPAASVLVKGSRFMRMEQVVQALQAMQGRQGTPEGTGHAA